MKYLSFIILPFILFSCLTHLPTEPEFIINDNYSTQLSDISKSNMAGVYKVEQGNDLLGNEIIGRWIDRRWCMYAEDDVIFSENAGGIISGTVLFSGYLRQVRSGSGVRLNLSISSNDGANELLSGDVPSKIILQGETSEGTNVVLRRVRQLHNSSRIYHIIAHRGGGRNSERLGRSENSIEMIRFAETLGATGVEIDVKRTRDGHLIVFHDDTFSPRTVQGSYLIGNVENFDLEQIKLFGQLIYGEVIPTLDEALDVIIFETNLNLIWLDLKDPEIIDNVILAQQRAIDKAITNGKNIIILLGIPTQEILNAYRSSSFRNTTPVLIELDSESALSLPTCGAWAPRWTNGIHAQSLINQMHSRNILVFTWTLDVKEYIYNFLESDIDGILSNYPSLVAGMYYSR